MGLSWCIPVTLDFYIIHPCVCVCVCMCVHARMCSLVAAEKHLVMAVDFMKLCQPSASNYLLLAHATLGTFLSVIGKHEKAIYHLKQVIMLVGELSLPSDANTTTVVLPISKTHHDYQQVNSLVTIGGQLCVTICNLEQVIMQNCK